MYEVNAIYDRDNSKFTKPVKKTQENILQYFNTWDKDDVDCVAEIIKERKIFSLNRTATVHQSSRRFG